MLDLVTIRRELRGHPLHSEKFSPDERAIEPAVRLIGDYLTWL